MFYKLDQRQLLDARNPFSVNCFVSTQYYDGEGACVLYRAAQTLHASITLLENPQFDGPSSLRVLHQSLSWCGGTMMSVVFCFSCTTDMGGGTSHAERNARHVGEDVRLCFVLAMPIPRVEHRPGGVSEYSSREAVMQTRIIEFIGHAGPDAASPAW